MKMIQQKSIFSQDVWADYYKLLSSNFAIHV